MYTVHCTLYTVYSIQCIVYSVQCTVYTVTEQSKRAFHAESACVRSKLEFNASLPAYLVHSVHRTLHTGANSGLVLLNNCYTTPICKINEFILKYTTILKYIYVYIYMFIYVYITSCNMIYMILIHISNPPVRCNNTIPFWLYIYLLNI